MVALSKPKYILLLLTLASLTSIPLISAQVTVGGSGGNVTFTNPDDGTIYFDSTNQTTFQYISNYPDGWWNFPDPSIADNANLWVIGLMVGLLAIGLVVSFMVMKNRKSDNE